MQASQHLDRQIFMGMTVVMELDRFPAYARGMTVVCLDDGRFDQADEILVFQIMPLLLLQLQ
jgi:hypothetical protein